MLGPHRVVGLIPARAGSKGVPRKNLREIGGKPLLSWSIDTALRVPGIDRIIVSTDGAEISEVATSAGVEASARPAALATDTAVVADVIRYEIRRLRSEGEEAVVMVLLEPTSPFRTATMVTDCLRKLEAESLDSVATFIPAHLNPHRAWRIVDNQPEAFIEGANPWLPRQRLPEAYQLSGTVYAFRLDRLPESGSQVLFGAAGALIIDPLYSMDIDNELDFVIADAVLSKGLISVDQ